MDEQIYVPLELKFANDAPAGSFSGYGAMYGNIDDGGDRFLPGAFANSIAQAKAAGRSFPMYMQHGAVLGADPRPVGKWTSVAEDDKGLKVDGQLIGLDTETGRYNYALVKEGAMDGLSVGYRVKKADYGREPGQPRRSIKEAMLGEISIVDQPMNAFARVHSIKSIDELEDLNGMERYLREVGGVSRSEAKALASRMLAIARREVAQEPERTADIKAIEAALWRRAARLTA